MPFTNRYTEGATNVLVLQYAAIFYWLQWPMVAALVWVAVRPSPIANAVAGALVVAAIANAIPNWKAVRELKSVMRTGSLNVSGSKYSLSNPLTYRWESLTSPLPPASLRE